MKHSKDLNWLSAPAFFLILGMLAFNSKKPVNVKHPEKIKTETSVLTVQKPA